MIVNAVVPLENCLDVISLVVVLLGGSKHQIVRLLDRLVQRSGRQLGCIDQGVDRAAPLLCHYHL